jgi:hypothetical protein
MTIDELFDMPILEMKEWLKKNYRDPQGYYKGDYWFTDIKECFGVEFPECCGWRIVPCMSTYRDKDTSALDKIKKKYYDNLCFGVTKISKYGECLTYMLSGRFTYEDTKKKYANGKKFMGFDYYIDRQYFFELESISSNDGYGKDAEPSYIFIGGPNIVNNSEIGVHYQLSNDYHDKWINKYPFIDVNDFIVYKSKPTLRSVDKNKHTLNEYANKIEEYAKKVQEIGVQAYNDNKSIIDDSEFVKKCKTVHLKPKEIFDTWLALYIENQNVTFDDVIGMCRLSESKENIIKEYVTKCKCNFIVKDYADKWGITEHPYYNCYHLCLLYGKNSYTNASGFYGYIKNLDKTREMYNSLDTYKDTLKYAKTAYQTNYKLMAQAFENKILDIYNEVIDKLEIVKNGYLEKSKEIYNDIHEKYPGVNDIDVGIFEDEPDIVNNIHKAFEKSAIMLMKKLDSKYKGLEHKKINVNKLKEKEDDTEFLNLCKKLFDASPKLKKIIYYSVHKAYDAPYEVYEDDCIEEKFSDDTIYDYEEKYGENSFNDWLDEFERLRPADPSDYHSLGQELYPGCSYNMFINRNLEYNEEDNVD